MTSIISGKTLQNLRKNQGGLYIVEFAVVGLAALIVLFGTLEVCRMMFTVNVLEEATRRGARIAAVCTVDNEAIARVTVFAASGETDSPILPDLTIANVEVQYLDDAGVPINDYATDDNRYMDIEYVRVQIINYTHNMIIPTFDLSFQTRAYPTTIPRESLGIPRPDQTSNCT
jgi:hypothetical protein